MAVLRRDNPEINLIKRDIYNATAKLSRAKRERKSLAEALINRLETEQSEGKIRFEWRRDIDGYIAMVFVADIRSAVYLNQYLYIILLDCIYKTNKFGMPLLHVLGVDHYGQSFTIALCFLDQEVAENYTEAVQYVRLLYLPGNWPSVIAIDCEQALISIVSTHFPTIRSKHVLCYQYISKCLLTHCKALFGIVERQEEFMQFFQKVMFSKTEDEYEDLLEEFKEEFNQNEGNLYLATLNLTPNKI